MPKTAPPLLEPTVDVETKTAPQWNVILHNDDVTPMDFVVWLLISLFGRPFDDAVVLMLEVHESGVSIVHTCSQERAELYVEQVHSLARPRGYPLTASCESS